MVRHDLRLGICNLRKLLYECATDEAMQLLATTSHQTCISGVLDKSVLELICGVGRSASLVISSAWTSCAKAAFKSLSGSAATTEIRV